MRRQRAGRTRRVGVGLEQGFSGRRFDTRARQHTGPQQHGVTTRTVDDARLDAQAASPAVEHRDGLVELGQHVRGLGRADAAEAVGTGPGHAGHAALTGGEQQGMGDRVGRAAQTDAVLATCGGRGDAFSARHDDRQWPGPERVDQALRERRHV